LVGETTLILAPQARAHSSRSLAAGIFTGSAAHGIEMMGVACATAGRNHVPVAVTARKESIALVLRCVIATPR
jgi:hypothetical protein